VFTSTVNVAFSGKEIIGGNEETHKWPGVNFTNIIITSSFYKKDPKCAKNTIKLSVFLALLGSAGIICW